MVLHRFFQLTFILIFTPGPSVSGCSVNVTQPEEHIYGRINESVSIDCLVKWLDCADNEHQVFWYVFNSDSHHQLNTESQPHKYSVDNKMLQIKSLSHSDDGVYYCATEKTNHTTTFGMQAFGKGTTLMVTDNHFSTSQVLLLTLVVLLSIYSLIILSLIICIKMGRATSFIKKRTSKRQVKSDSNKSVHFGAVVQELCSKRNLHRNKKPSSNDVSQENKLKSPDGKDDIYQNLKRTR
ncbi:uncharacterized protein si:ch211-139g16.8 [Trichomycterus rosablanca]|uniref:uncharacterized protein si:ch211-139g16.8 n=1 Tax=Trichomycterus rosablanca TaxID=2290929 RepID=UPI002F35823E